MVTARYLTKKLIEPLERKRREEEDALERSIRESHLKLIAQGRAEGIAQGREEGFAKGFA